MIPKIIHYIWLGNNPLPAIAQKCIESWKKFCPDYEIKRWDESNLNIDQYKFARDAYNAKKYAFAADVMRLDILIKEGGIYFDIDVELLKPIDNLIDGNECFMGFETSNCIAPGLILATISQNQDLMEILNFYKENEFDEAKMKEMTICEIFTRYYEGFGLERVNRNQKIGNTMFYSAEFFSPIDVVTNKKHITKQTYSIHWYNASWYSSKQKLKKRIKFFFNVITLGCAGKIICLIKTKIKKTKQVENK